MELFGIPIGYAIVGTFGALSIRNIISLHKSKDAGIANLTD